MTHGHFFFTGKHREAGKQSLLDSTRQRLAKGLLVALSLVALVSSFVLTQAAPQAFAASPTTSATHMSGTSLTSLSPTQQTSQVSVGQATPAVQSKPPTNLSFYITTGSTTVARSLGCNQGKTDRRDGHQSHVILDFGAQASNGSGTFLAGTSTFISNRQIEKVVEAFAQGYSNCIGRTRRVTLGVDIGTNNSGSGVGFANGRTWARLVLAVRSFNRAHHLSAHVATFGADDIESFGSAPATIRWAKGYHSGGAGNYVNFGSLDGCPPAGGCSKGWTLFDYWSVSNRSVAWVVPEIYNGTQASQWEQLDLYSVRHHHSALVFLGPLDQHNITPGCCNGTNNTATQSWDQLWRALHSHKTTAEKLLFSMEIRWEPRR